ncbi:MAG: hypothetical protein IJR93_07530 [Treponema sp.]|nr:hypothetical protein [Treponema sp.]
METKTLRAFFKLLCKSLLVMLPLLILQIYLRSCQLAYSDNEVPYYNWVKKLKGNGFDVVIIGDSTCNAAYLPNILGENVVNISLGGVTPIENYHLFQNYIKNNKKPKVCYISYADMHLQQIDYFYSRVLYSHILTFSQEAEILRQAQKFNETLILVDNWKEKWISTFLYSPAVYQPALMASSFAERLEHNRHMYHNAEIHLGSYISRENGESWGVKPYTKNDFIVKPLFEFYYNRLIELCMQEGITVRLVKLPVSPPVTHSQKYKDEFNAFYASLCSNYPRLTLDWFQDEFDQHDFADWHHMNLVGATRFSQLIRERYHQDFSDAPKSQRTKEGLEDYLDISSSPELKEYLNQQLQSR